MTRPSSRPRLTVVVVDDSASNRKHLTDVLLATGEVDVVGEAADGEEALRQVFRLKPDAVTLDLEMPGMNGFSFLRIVMSKRPLPVIVISQHSEKESVFKALEFGAVDFVEKPRSWTKEGIKTLSEQLRNKIELVRQLGKDLVSRRIGLASAVLSPRPSMADAETSTAAIPRGSAHHVVCIASSAGGPAALIEIFSQLPDSVSSAFVVAQHMPEKFTRSFAQRLSQRSKIRVTEARNGDLVSGRRAFICPGHQCMEVEGQPDPTEMRLRLVSPRNSDRYVPSADRLFASVARVAKTRAVGIVLTGMGDDGTEGARAIRKHGGIVIAESKDSAVVPGMPTAAIQARVVSHIMSLADIVAFLVALG